MRQDLVFRLHPRRLESLTVCRCHYKAAHSFQIFFQTLSVGLPRVWTTADRCSPNWANQVVVILKHDVRLQHNLIPSNDMCQYPDFNTCNSAFNGQCKESTEPHEIWPRSKGAQINILEVIMMRNLYISFTFNVEARTNTLISLTRLTAKSSRFPHHCHPNTTCTPPQHWQMHPPA